MRCWSSSKEAAATGKGPGQPGGQFRSPTEARSPASACSVRARTAGEAASRRHHTIAAGLSLGEAQAQAHCHHPDNSSLTCRTEVGNSRTRQFGQWLDGYVHETKHSEWID